MKTVLITLGLVMFSQVVSAGDWVRFRGPNGSGVSSDSIPTTWDEKTNLQWKTKLPGAGSSSPIVLGERVYVTCFSGAGGRDLKRQLVCVDRSNGKIVWSKAVAAEQPEDAYNGFLREHGYASSTPVTDGERIYVFYGKTGVFAFDLKGNQLWKTGVGKESSGRRWGSSSSPILYKDFVIVTASDESQSIRALDKKTGKEVWKAEAGGLELTFSTPLIVTLKDGRQELAIAVPYEVWGLNPDTGKLTWYAKCEIDGNATPSVVAMGEVVYAIGGRRGGCIAVRCGGKGNVTATHVLWKSRHSSYVPSPVQHNGHLYWVNDRGVAYCVNAKKGELVYQKRLAGVGGGGFGGRPFYASITLANDKLYAVSRTSGTFVFAAKPEFQQLALNRFASDKTDFNASPAISDGQMILRSNEFLYCVKESD